jgi:hypothetical protein
MPLIVAVYQTLTLSQRIWAQGSVNIVSGVTQTIELLILVAAQIVL